MKPPPLPKDNKTITSVEKNVREQLEMGVYELVQETEEQEMKHRHEFQSWFRRYQATKQASSKQDFLIDDILLIVRTIEFKER